MTEGLEVDGVLWPDRAGVDNFLLTLDLIVPVVSSGSVMM